MAPIEFVRLQPDVFVELQNKHPSLSENRFKVVNRMLGKDEQWILSLSVPDSYFPYEVITVLFGLEGLQEESQSLVLAILGQARTVIRRLKLLA